MICPGLEVGIVKGESKETSSQVVISSIQALYRPQNLASLAEQNFDLLIYDEAHRAGAEMSRQILKDLGFGPGTKKLLVGFSATPSRQDGLGLGEIFDEITFEKDIKWMINAGYLCKPRGLKVATDLDLSSIKTVDGDFQASSLAELMDTPELISLVVEAYKQHAEYLSTICFTTSIKHAGNIAEAFNKAGVIAESVSGETPKDLRDNLISKFKNGEISVLANCQLLTEGFDSPETSCVIVARPTKSQALYQQMVGRGLRLWPNKKECVVLDFCDKAHSLCSTGMLLGDSEVTKQKEEEERKRAIEERLPLTLNKKLKAAIISFDPLGDSFVWQKEGGTYLIKGSGKARIEIISQDNDRFSAVLTNLEGSNQDIATNLTFEYAFSCAEDYAREHKQLFVMSDKEAAWRDLPISEKQLNLLRSYGYRAGIANLTRGQAASLIGSGCLRKAS